MSKSKNLLDTRTSILAALAALLFSFQHPFSKQAADFFNPFLLGVFYSIISLLVFIPIMWTINLTNVKSVLRCPRALAKFIILSLFGWISLISYIIGLNSTHPLLASLLINTSPLFAAVWTKCISKTKLPSGFWIVTLSYFLSFPIFASISKSGIDYISPFSFLLLMVPLFYTLRGHLSYWWFRDIPQQDILFSSSVVSVIICIIALIPILLYRTVNISFSNVDASNFFMFVIGTVSGVFGTIVYQKAIQRSKGNSAYVSSFNLLIPSLSGFIGWNMATFFGYQDLEPEMAHILNLVPILLMLSIFSYNQIKNKK